jgi:hypothetical protein
MDIPITREVGDSALSQSPSDVPSKFLGDIIPAGSSESTPTLLTDESSTQ